MKRFQDFAAEIYTIPEVINELKCEKMRHLLDSLPYQINIREPTTDALHKG